MSRLLVLVLSLAAVLAASTSVVRAQEQRQPGFYNRLGGLPVLYPKQPVADCTGITDCRACTSIPNCAFCYEDLFTIFDGPIPIPILRGTCSDFSNLTTTQMCLREKRQRFYIPGQCEIPFRPGCKIDTNGTCIIPYAYNDSLANVNELEFAHDFLIGVMVCLGFLTLVYLLCTRLTPYYGKWSNYDEPFLPPYFLSAMLCFILQLTGLACNEFAYATKEDGLHRYGLFGEWGDDVTSHHWYDCDQANPNVNLTYCKVLPCAVIIVAIFVYLAMFCLTLGLIGLLVSCCCTDNDNFSVSPLDGAFWYAYFIGAVSSVGGVLIWTSAHILISENMLRPYHDGPISTLQTGKSWHLQITCAILHIYACLAYGIKINCMEPPGNWTPPIYAKRDGGDGAARKSGADPIVNPMTITQMHIPTKKQDETTTTKTNTNPVNIQMVRQRHQHQQQHGRQQPKKMTTSGVEGDRSIADEIEDLEVALGLTVVPAAASSHHTTSSSVGPTPHPSVLPPPYSAVDNDADADEIRRAVAASLEEARQREEIEAARATDVGPNNNSGYGHPSSLSPSSYVPTYMTESNPSSSGLISPSSAGVVTIRLEGRHTNDDAAQPQSSSSQPQMISMQSYTPGALMAQFEQEQPSSSASTVL